ncbi:MAG: hypothetical protein MUE50_14325 [Pirellulaceae bacterium]|jgi:hypothetical protein|nr:hypothetical protein [Pirellulaceae bacterium]
MTMKMLTSKPRPRLGNADACDGLVKLVVKAAPQEVRVKEVAAVRHETKHRHPVTSREQA